MLVIAHSGLRAARRLSPGASLGSALLPPQTAAVMSRQAIGISDLPTLFVPLPPSTLQDDGTFSTVVDADGLTDVVSVTVGGNIYNLDISGTGAPGTFTFTPATGTLTLASSTPIPTGSTAIATGFTRGLPPIPSLNQFATNYPTNVLIEAVPEFLSRWNVVGTFQIDRSLGGSPTAQFNLVVHKSDRDSVLAFFRPKQRLELYGAPFECQIPAMVEKPNDEFLDFAIQLRGGWERQAAEPVRMVLTTAQNVTRTSLQTLCGRAGMPYIGPAVGINVPRGTPRSASTSVMSEASSRAIVQNCFLYLSNPSGFELRRYDATPIRYLNKSDILSPINHSMGGMGASYRGVPLVAEFKNLEVTLAPEIEVAQNITEALQSGHTNPTRPYTKLVLNNGEADESNTSMECRDSNAWWPSGPSKSWRQTISLNNSPTEEEEKVYAMLGSPLNVYGVRGLSFGEWEDFYRNESTAGYWTLVKHVRTFYEYDNDGYLKRVVTRGWQSMNFSAGDLLDLRKQYADEEGGDGALLRSLYNEIMLGQFREPIALGQNAYEPSTNAPPWANLSLALEEMSNKVPIYDVTTFELEKMKSYYPDMGCRSDDPDFVEPLFCIEEKRASEDLIFAPDPRNIADTEYKRSPKVTGQRRVERKTIDIIYPRKSTPLRLWDQRREKFNTITLSSNYIGGDLAQSNVDETFAITQGRPSVHTRRIKYKGGSVARAAVAPETNRRIILNTPGSGGVIGGLEGGSTSFPDTFTVESAVNAARYQLNQQNLGAYSISFDVDPSAALNWQEGDRIQYDGKLWQLMSISQARVIEGPGRITANGWPVSLGFIMDIPVSKTLLECKG